MKKQPPLIENYKYNLNLIFLPLHFFSKSDWTWDGDKKIDEEHFSPKNVIFQVSKVEVILPNLWLFFPFNQIPFFSFLLVSNENLIKPMKKRVQLRDENQKLENEGLLQLEIINKVYKRNILPAIYTDSIPSMEFNAKGCNLSKRFLHLVKRVPI